MLRLNVFIVAFAIFGAANAGVLLWGAKPMHVPSLKHFTNEDLEVLKQRSGVNSIVVFTADPLAISSDFEELLRNKYTAYVPNARLSFDDVIELSGDSEENLKLIRESLTGNELALIISTSQRNKRELDSDSDSDSEPETTTPETEPALLTTEASYEPPSSYENISGPVLYSAGGKAMLYSAQPLLLKTNSTILKLGKQALATLDNRPDKYSKLSVTIPVSEGKVMLRFKFVWRSGYWTLPSAEVLDTDSRAYTLHVTRELTASKNFSYHCTGHTSFADPENNVELTLFDLQLQPDTKNGRFDDAYDCVFFTTVPIWSGLFVTSILVVVLFVGLNALDSIKTMDKFDNNKTKQLTFTIANE